MVEIITNEEENLAIFMAKMKKTIQHAARDTPDKIMKGLYLGVRPSAENSQHLTGLGIKHILQISDKERDPPFPQDFVYYRFVMRDSAGVDLTPHFQQANSVIADCINKSEPILVHCEQGISRSSSFIISYLIITWKMTFD